MMPVKEWYWRYKTMPNRRHYERILKASREYYRRQMADPEKAEQMRAKCREKYLRQKEKKNNG